MSKSTVEYVKIPDEITLISEEHHREKYSGDSGSVEVATVANNITIISLLVLLITLAFDAFFPFAAAGRIITVAIFSSIISFVLLGIITAISAMEDSFLLENFMKSIKNRRGNKTSSTMSSILHIRHTSSVWANPVLAALNPFRFIKPTTLSQNVYYDVKSDIYSRETTRLGFVRISTKVEKFGGPRYAFVKAIDALEESR